MKAKRKTGEDDGMLHCFECDQICCRTAAIEVEAPKSLRDWSDLLFYLYHDKTQIVIAKNGRSKEWYVEFMTPCKNLVDGRCADYEKRPLVCRDYEMDGCERNTENPFTYLRTPEEFFEYLKAKGKKKILKKISKTHRVPADGPKVKSKPVAKKKAKAGAK